MAFNPAWLRILESLTPTSTNRSSQVRTVIIHWTQSIAARDRNGKTTYSTIQTTPSRSPGLSGAQTSLYPSSRLSSPLSATAHTHARPASPVQSPLGSSDRSIRPSFSSALISPPVV